MVVGPGESLKAGGFLTGWKGIAIFISMIAVAAVLAVTGIQADRNTFPRLSPAELEFNVGDYGLGALYAPCITNGSFIGKRWVYDIPVPGSDNRFVEEIDLGDRRLLEQLSDGGIDPAVRFNNNPEFVCFVICRLALGDQCTYFTYEGLDADSCRIGAPDFPMEDIQESEPEEFRFVYNATCMQRRREQLIAPIEFDQTDLLRPGRQAGLGSVAEAERLQPSILASTQFLRGQWAGPLPTDYVQRGGPEWRVPGFIDLADNCGTESIPGSFATGDHVVVTMATANQLAVMSLALAWWGETIGQLGGRGVRADRDEILRSAAYLVRAWEPTIGESGRLLLGVGTQLNSNGIPELYSDFGDANDALQIGLPEFENGQKTPVPAECSYTRPNQPDIATAAHAAAALALGSIATAELTAGGGDISPADMLEVAAELYSYSIVNQPIAGNPQFQAFNATEEYAASQLYPLEDPAESPLQVRSHQLWAACALWQATEEMGYWNDTLKLYDLYFDSTDTTLDGSPLYNPSANYRNPTWYALLCMAQSAPDASNIADDPLLAVPEHVDPSAEDPANETAAGWRIGQRDQYRQYLRAQLPELGTRMEVMRQITNNFVYPWLTLQSQGRGSRFVDNERLSASTPDNFHYFDLNGGDEEAVGTASIVRDSAHAAVVSLVWADLPGLDEEAVFQARCMAKQQVDFILGKNADQLSLQALEIGDATPIQNFWHKDAACPDEDTRAELFSPVAAPNPDFNDTPSDPGPRVFFSTRRCDFLTMFGNNTDPTDNPQLVEALLLQNETVPELLDPVLPNANVLIGALAATFDVSGEGPLIADQRAVCEDGSTDISACPRPGDQIPNPQTQVSIDTNAAFFAAVTGVVALPEAFWARVAECPAPGARVAAAQAVRDEGLADDREAIQPLFIQEATADPNLTIQGPDNGLRVPRRSGTPAPAADADVEEEAADADEGRR